MSDIQAQLLDMGFPLERVEIASKKSGGSKLPFIYPMVLSNKLFTVQGALQWLEDNQDKTMEQIQAESKPADDDETNSSIEPAPLKEGEVSRSMICNECGKKFRSMAQVEFHASKT